MRLETYQYILVSGDNHSKVYDEPMCMKETLMEKGIPESAIYLDYTGLRTQSLEQKRYLDQIRLQLSRKSFTMNGLSILPDIMVYLQ